MTINDPFDLEKPATAPCTATPQLTSQILDEKMQHVLSLMVARSRGEVSNDQVESAVSMLLDNAPPSTPHQATTLRVPLETESKIEQDNENYDNLNDDEEQPTVKTEAKQVHEPVKWTDIQATVKSMRKPDDDDEKSDPLDRIPLGKAGARMMVTFGDGATPRPDAVAAALLGARRCLQVAIKDARALRRHTKEEYLRARRTILMSRKFKSGSLSTADQEREAVDPNMLYRAMAGYDKLAYDPKCGFDIEQLHQLFPEEMGAYTKWNQMHNEYEASSKEDGAVPSDNADDDDGGREGRLALKEDDVVLSNGHLEERAAQFDARTEQMNDDWYMKFSEVRQGSFLPRGRKKAEDKPQEASRRGRRKESRNWENMSAASVRFLHWVGFDPRSALPPPNDETTQALAYLGYDFMGNIVEKAIYLRNVANKKDSDLSGDKDVLLELRKGEQLEAADIEKALNDSAIRPVSIYSSSADDFSNHQVAAQLYFGPGFEDRLEMEIEELLSGAKKRKRLSSEEQDIRTKEDALFSDLLKPPKVLDGVAQLMDDCTREEDNSEHSHDNDDPPTTL